METYPTTIKLFIDEESNRSNFYEHVKRIERFYPE